MIHEGPLLEYAGRDQAYLQWAAAARHWLVLVLAVQIFLPASPRAVVAARAPARLARGPVRRSRADGDPRCQDARPARTAPARRRGDRSAAGNRRTAGGHRVSGALAWVLVGARPRRRRRPAALGRRRAAHRPGAHPGGHRAARAASGGDVVGGAALGVRALGLAGLFASSCGARASRDPSRRDVRRCRGPAAAVAFALDADLARTGDGPRLARRPSERRSRSSPSARRLLRLAARRSSRSWRSCSSRTGSPLRRSGSRGHRALIELGVTLDLTLGRARRGRLPRADLRRVRRRRQRGAEEPP